MIKIIFIAIGMAVAAFMLYATTRPDSFHIERTVRINAAPAAIYPYMSDFHKGKLWVPYEQKDPGMKRTFSGAESGKGSIYEFAGNKNVGQGRLEIVEATAPTHVVLTLDMTEPMQAHNRVDYTIVPMDNGSQVTWAMSGTCGYLGKLVGIFMNVDKMVGKDFTTGLANLKTLVESK
jgi:uncharacterized protein YndB with AHSA1/START domain